METIRFIIQILVAVAGTLAALASVMLFVRLRWPAVGLWFVKLYASALSPMLVGVGVLIVLAGVAMESVLISSLGGYVAVVFFIHVIRVTRPPDFSSGFEKAFGAEWEKRIAAERKKYFLRSRTVLRLPAVPEPRFEQNFPFATIPGSERRLLADIWQAPAGVAPSGLAFIYLHGSAFYLLDKDFGTRPFFRHLAAQGHVVMDVAYRLAPETDIMGMIHDVKRAVAWMKGNAAKFGVNPTRIVVGGGSAGGHLALMAAFTAASPQFLPKDLEGKDLGVRAVVSLYGTADLKAVYFHTNQHLTTREVPGQAKKPVPTKMPAWMEKSIGQDFHRLGFDKGFENAGALAPLLGGHPDECPETYALFSPINHVHTRCPPVLLLHGEHDIMAPVKSTRDLHARLTAERVPSVMHILPQSDHIFDLVMPETSPAAHTAYFEVERFMALMI